MDFKLPIPHWQSRLTVLLEDILALILACWTDYSKAQKWVTFWVVFIRMWPVIWQRVPWDFICTYLFVKWEKCQIHCAFCDPTQAMYPYNLATREHPHTGIIEEGLIFQILHTVCSVVWLIDKFDTSNTLRHRQNGRHFEADIFKRVFLNEADWIWIHISLKYIPEGPIVHMPALVQKMAWRRICNKPLSEPMMA